MIYTHSCEGVTRVAIGEVRSEYCGSRWWGRSYPRRCDILISIPGIGLLTAFALLIETPELGTLEPGDAPLSGLPSTCRPWSRHASIPTSRTNTPSSSVLASPRSGAVRHLCRLGRLAAAGLVGIWSLNRLIIRPCSGIGGMISPMGFSTRCDLKSLISSAIQLRHREVTE